MTAKKSNLEKRQLPSVFTNVSPQGGSLQYDSLDLCKKNAKLRHSLNEIYVLSFTTVQKLIDDVRTHIGSLYKVCEGVAMLDMVGSQSEKLIADYFFRIFYKYDGYGFSSRLLINSSATRV